MEKGEVHVAELKRCILSIVAEKYDAVRPTNIARLRGFLHSLESQQEEISIRIYS
jgi:hypothetical protein